MPQTTPNGPISMGMNLIPFARPYSAADRPAAPDPAAEAVAAGGPDANGLAFAPAPIPPSMVQPQAFQSAFGLPSFQTDAERYRQLLAGLHRAVSDLQDIVDRLPGTVPPAGGNACT